MDRVELVLGLLEELHLTPHEVRAICERLHVLPSNVTVFTSTPIRWTMFSTRTKNVLQNADIGSDELLSMMTDEYFASKTITYREVNRYLSLRGRQLRGANETVEEKALKVFGGLGNLPVEYLFVEGRGDSTQLHELGCRILNDLRRASRLQEELSEYAYDCLVRKLHEIGFEL